MRNQLFLTIVVCAAIFILPAFASAQGKCTEPGSITRVTKARAGNLETITFDVNSTSPDYTVETAHPPFNYSESDTRVRVRGKFFKSINFKSVFWTCTIVENFSAPTGTIMDVKNTDQFEGYISYVIGYRTRSKYAGTTKSTVGGKTKVVVKFRR